MSADLLERARSAVTVEEECDVIRAALAMAYEHGSDALTAIVNVVLRVSIGELPRPVLLGVVAALVPEGPVGLGLHGYAGLSRWSAEIVSRRLLPETFEDDVAEGRGPTPALALLIAILEAENG